MRQRYQREWAGCRLGHGTKRLSDPGVPMPPTVAQSPLALCQRCRGYYPSASGRPRIRRPLAQPPATIFFPPTVRQPESVPCVCTKSGLFPILVRQHQQERGWLARFRPAFSPTNWVRWSSKGLLALLNLIPGVDTTTLQQWIDEKLSPSTKRQEVVYDELFKMRTPMDALAWLTEAKYPRDKALEYVLRFSLQFRPLGGEQDPEWRITEAFVQHLLNTGETPTSLWHTLQVVAHQEGFDTYDPFIQFRKVLADHLAQQQELSPHSIQLMIVHNDRMANYLERELERMQHTLIADVLTEAVQAFRRDKSLTGPVTVRRLPFIVRVANFTGDSGHRLFPWMKTEYPAQLDRLAQRLRGRLQLGEAEKGLLKQVVEESPGFLPFLSHHTQPLLHHMTSLREGSAALQRAENPAAHDLRRAYFEALHYPGESVQVTQPGEPPVIIKIGAEGTGTGPTITAYSRTTSYMGPFHFSQGHVIESSSEREVHKLDTLTITDRRGEVFFFSESNMKHVEQLVRFLHDHPQVGTQPLRSAIFRTANDAWASWRSIGLPWRALPGAPDNIMRRVETIQRTNWTEALRQEVDQLWESVVSKRVDLLLDGYNDSTLSGHLRSFIERRIFEIRRDYEKKFSPEHLPLFVSGLVALAQLRHSDQPDILQAKQMILQATELAVTAMIDDRPWLVFPGTRGNLINDLQFLLQIPVTAVEGWLGNSTNSPLIRRFVESIMQSDMVPNVDRGRRLIEEGSYEAGSIELRRVIEDRQPENTERLLAAGLLARHAAARGDWSAVDFALLEIADSVTRVEQANRRAVIPDVVRDVILDLFTGGELPIPLRLPTALEYAFAEELGGSPTLFRFRSLGESVSRIATAIPAPPADLEALPNIWLRWSDLAEEVQHEIIALVPKISAELQGLGLIAAMPPDLLRAAAVLDDAEFRQWLKAHYEHRPPMEFLRTFQQLSTFRGYARPIVIAALSAMS
jgi:hypothetical protein